MPKANVLHENKMGCREDEWEKWRGTTRAFVFEAMGEAILRDTAGILYDSVESMKQNGHLVVASRDMLFRPNEG